MKNLAHSLAVLYGTFITFFERINFQLTTDEKINLLLQTPRNSQKTK